jgi:hypothetical protein
MDNPGHYDEYPELTRADKMTPTTPSPIPDQAAGEPVPDLPDFPPQDFYANDKAFWDAMSMRRYAHAYADKIRLSTAPTTGSAPVAWMETDEEGHPIFGENTFSDCAGAFEHEVALGIISTAASRAASVLSDDLRDSVLSALDDLKLVIDGTMGAVGLETTFVSLVEALEADRAVDSDWRCRRNNAFDRLALLAASMGGDRK